MFFSSLGFGSVQEPIEKVGHNSFFVRISGYQKLHITLIFSLFFSEKALWSFCFNVNLMFLEDIFFSFFTFDP